jgi:hypothetical protein
VIAGDALQRRAGRLTTPARLVTADWPAALRSIHTLAALDCQTLAFSHFPPLRGTAREELRQLVHKLDRRETLAQGRA